MHFEDMGYGSDGDSSAPVRFMIYRWNCRLTGLHEPLARTSTHQTPSITRPLEMSTCLLDGMLDETGFVKLTHHRT